jgi:serine/threonine protein kinase
VLVDQDISTVNGINDKASWIRLEVSRMQTSYLQGLTASATYERPIDGGGGKQEAKSSAGQADASKPSGRAPAGPALSMQPDTKNPSRASGQGESKAADELGAELRAGLEAANAQLRPSVLSLTQQNHQQMNIHLSRAITMFDDQMSLDNSALILLKNVIDVSMDSYDVKKIRKLETEIGNTIQKYATATEAQKGLTEEAALANGQPLMKTRGMGALSDALEQLKTKRALLKDHFQPVLSISDFKFLRLLNEGAFAKVYQAHRKNDSSQQNYAIKVMDKKFIKQQDMVKRVKRECKVMKSTGSNRDMFVRLYSSMQSRNYLFIVMEFVRGGDFLTQLAKYGKFPESTARFYIAELCLAVAYLHDHGVVHRDIKLDNILLTDRGHLKLMDFGMVTPSNSLLDRKVSLLAGDDGGDNGWIESLSFTGTGKNTEDQSSNSFSYTDSAGQLRSVVGNYHYASPEVVLELGYDHAVDWWSCGILLFQFLTGTTPFMAKTAERTVDNIAEYRINWKAIPEDVSQGAKDLISGLLAYNAKERLGAARSADVINHPYFAGIDFDTIYSQTGPLQAAGVKEAKSDDQFPEMKEDFLIDPPEFKNDEFESFCMENMR